MNRSAVIFDLDGTLTKPYFDFDAIRAEIGLPPGPILEALELLPEPDRRRADEILLRHEWMAARNAELHEGAVEVVAECRRRKHPVAILTRNRRPTAEYVLRTHHIEVDALRTREDGAIKPAAEPVFALCTQLKADPARSWVVGDYLFDVLSGKGAGTRTVLMIGDRPPPSFADQADFIVRRLADLLPILQSAAPS